MAFLLSHSKVRLNDSAVKEREISIHFDPERLLHIDYLIDGKSVSSKTFTPSEYVCERRGLRLQVHKRAGEQVFDVLPNQGTLTIEATLFRVEEYLYVKTTCDTKATFYHVIPSSSLSVWWSRFLVR